MNEQQEVQEGYLGMSSGQKRRIKRILIVIDSLLIVGITIFAIIN